MKTQNNRVFRWISVGFMLLLSAQFTSIHAASVTDELTWTINGSSQGASSYVSFTDKTLNSTAVYAGNAASKSKDDPAIQLRSTNNSGIVTTASGGTVKSIKVKWNSDTNSGRVLKVYGKNTAYASSEDLYSTSSDTKGTEIASFAMSDGEQTITISGTYEYIGIRSNSGALYIEQIDIVWEEASSVVTVTPPAITGTNNFSSTTTVSITADAGCSIRYTTDGTTPSASSTLYTAPFSISETTTVKAIAIDASNNVSEVSTQTFTKSSVPAEGDSATYIFNTQTGLSQLGLAVPEASSGTNLETTAYTISPVSMTTTSGSTATRIWNTSGKYDLRVYTNGSLTFSVPEGYYLTGITFTQGTKTDFKFTAGSGTLSGYVWTPANTTTESVTFTASGTSYIGTITVNYAVLGSAPVAVTNFNELKALESGKNVILTLSESNAAVIQYVDPPSAARTSSAQNAYIRDNYSAVQFANVASASRSWHTQASGALIGKIYGQYVVENGMPKFVENSKTNAWQMLCLDNYAAITPRTVSVADLTTETYRADYVELTDVALTKSGSDYYLTDGTNQVLVENGFNLSSITMPTAYAGSRFNVTGIINTNTESASDLYLLTLQKTTTLLTLAENQVNSTQLTQHDGESVNLTMTRQLTSGTWNTLCLPFDVADATELLGQVHVAELTGYNAADNVLEFTTTTNIEAGKPYLVYPTGETASNITLNAIEVSATTIPVTYGSYTFTPVFDPTELQKDDQTTLFLAANNQLYYPSVTAEMKAFRAYFKRSGSRAPARIDVDGATTGITTIDLDNAASGQTYYDLSGRKVGTESNINQKGIYVKEGSKVIIK